MPEPVCRSQESGGYEMVFLLLALFEYFIRNTIL